MDELAYYNEFDPYAADWLERLIAGGHIAPGIVDRRSIVDVRPSDLVGYRQCHFFAGIGGWSLALRLAGWSDARPLWTGSCPCQPFSAAGKGQAGDDERHLYPVWASLIAECRPGTILGEQVEAAIGWGWLDVVFTDLEAQGYACASAVLPACGVGAPHIRQRVWFVADAGSAGTGRNAGHAQRAPAEGTGSGHQYRGDIAGQSIAVRAIGIVADADAPGQRIERSGGLLDGERAALGHDADGRGEGSMVDPASEQMGLPRRTRQPRGSSHWSDLIWLPCTDGRSRPAKPGIQPLAHGVSARVGKLRAAGNAIVPQVAAEFIGAFMDG